VNKFKALCDEYKEISNTRNLIAHAGFADKEEAYKEAIDKLHTHIRNTEKYVFNNMNLKQIPELFPFNTLNDK